MRAIVCPRYGGPDDLALEDVEKPVPRQGEALIAVRAASVNAADRVLIRGKPFIVRLMGMGLVKPRHRVPGIDIAGTVEAVGPGVTRFRPGDEVFGTCDFGGFADYARAAESTLVTKPAGVSFAEAAATPTAACTALQGLRDGGRIEAGHTVLIDGASGGVGFFAIQIAKHLGAEVTAVCSTRHVETARSLGAQRVIDSTQQDFVDEGPRYDVIHGANAYRPLADYKRALKPDGTYVMTGGGGAQWLEALLVGKWISMTGSRKMRSLLAQPTTDDLSSIAKLLESGVIAPIIDRSFALGEVPDAIRYVESRQARGKIVVTM